MNTKSVLGVLLIVSILIPVFLGETSKADGVADGYYRIPISLINKHYENQKSMGNPALTQYGIVSIKSGKATMRIKFVALDFMNYRGFLGEFYVKGQKVNELSYYDDIDVYNNPSTGTDKRMKGKKYPKELEFEVEIGEKDIPVAVYVPVMEEVSGGNGGGQQEARLRVAWPSDYNSVKVGSNSFDGSNQDLYGQGNGGSTDQVQDDLDGIYSPKDNRNLPVLEKGENIKLEDGIYSLTVNLHHEREDKPSMGNGSMVHTANIIAKDGKYTMLIGSDKMEVQGIIASLVSLQIRDDNAYYRFAQPHAFDLEIPNEEDKRPRVFSFEIDRMDPMIYVKVDPKVKPMGEIPIGARFKFDWSSLKKISESEASLYRIMKTGTPRKKFNPKESFRKKTDIFELFANPGTFKENIKFKVDKVTGGSDYTKVMNKFGRSTEFVIYNFKVENDYGVPLKPNKTFDIKFKLPSNIKNPKAVYVSDMSNAEIKSSNGYANLKLNRLGQVAIVSSGKDSIPRSSSKRSSGSGMVSRSASNGVRSNNGSRATNRGKKSKESSVNPTKTNENDSATGIGELKNDSTSFDTGESQEEQNQSTDGESKTGNKIYKENPKVIFYSLLMLIAIIGGSIYTYLKIGKKLMYEIRLGKKLKYEFLSGNKNRASGAEDDSMINSWLDLV